MKEEFNIQLPDVSTLQDASNKQTHCLSLRERYMIDYINKVNSACQYGDKEVYLLFSNEELIKDFKKTVEKTGVKVEGEETPCPLVELKISW